MGLLIVLFLSGFLLVRGIWMLKGGSKGWYFSRNIYAGSSYVQIPFGIAFLLLAISAILQIHDSWVLLDLAMGFMILGVIFLFLQPSFLKPAWLRWLQREHQGIMHILIDEAHAMDLNIWEKQMKTQADLEEWVEEVRRKHGL